MSRRRRRHRRRLFLGGLLGVVVAGGAAYVLLEATSDDDPPSSTSVPEGSAENSSTTTRSASVLETAEALMWAPTTRNLRWIYRAETSSSGLFTRVLQHVSADEATVITRDTITFDDPSRAEERRELVAMVEAGGDALTLPYALLVSGSSSVPEVLEGTAPSLRPLSAGGAQPVTGTALLSLPVAGSTPQEIPATWTVITGATESVTVRAGTFQATIYDVVVQLQAPGNLTLVSRLWIDDRVGLVRQVLGAEPNQVVLELVEITRAS